MSKFKSRSFIYNFDILSGTPGLFISGNKNFSTLCGLIITILILFLGFCYILYSLFNFIFKREMSIVEIGDNYMTKEVEIPLSKFLFAFSLFNMSMKYEYRFGQEIDEQSTKETSKIQLNEGFEVKLSYINPENKYVIESYIIEAEKCEKGKNINNDIIEKYDFNDYENYFCLNNNNNLKIILNKTVNTCINLVIVSKKSKNESGLNNQNLTYKDDVYYSESSFLQIEMIIADDIVTNKNMSNPLKYRKKSMNYGLISFGEFEFNEIMLKYIDYYSDKGIILRDSEEFNAISYDSVNKETRNLEYIEAAQNVLYSSYSFYLNPNYIQSYERTYKKLPDVLADITGIISALFTFGKLIISFLSQNYLEVEAFATVFKNKNKNELNKNNNIIRIKKNNENSINTNDTKIIKFIKKEKKNTILIMNDIDSKNSELINMKSGKTDKSLSYNYNKKKNISKKQKEQINILNNELKKNNTLIISDGESDKKVNNINYNNNYYYVNNKKVIDVITEMLGADINNKNYDKNVSFNFCDYFFSIFCSEKNNKTKVINTLAIFMEKSLSIEEIISRSIDIEKIIKIIKLKFKEEFDSINFMEIILNNNKELKQIFEYEKIKNNTI